MVVVTGLELLLLPQSSALMLRPHDYGRRLCSLFSVNHGVSMASPETQDEGL